MVVWVFFGGVCARNDSMVVSVIPVALIPSKH